MYMPALGVVMFESIVRLSGGSGTKFDMVSTTLFGKVSRKSITPMYKPTIVLLCDVFGQPMYPDGHNSVKVTPLKEIELSGVLNIL